MHTTHFRKPHHRTQALAVTLVSAALMLSACSSGSGSTKSSTTSGTPSSTTAAVSNDAALAYTGGMAGKADPAKSPIVIGFVNQQGGVVGWPESAVSVQAAVSYINDQLGGIKGHPIKLKTCFVVSSEEDGQTCGQQMANDPDVRAVVTGNLIVGNASLYKTIGTTKTVLGSPSTVPDFTAPDNANILGGGLGTLTAMAVFTATTLHAKNVAMVYGDDPGGQSAVSLIAPVLAAYGVKLTKVPVPDTSTDLIGAITAAKAQTADAFLSAVAAPSCIQIAKAQKQLGLTKPMVTTGLCFDASVKAALGDYPLWYYGQDTTSAFLPGADKQADTFVAELTQYAPKNANLGGFAPQPFAKMMVLARLLDQLGPDATSDELGKSVVNFTGPVWMGPDTIKCGALAQLRAICNQSGRIYQYQGTGKWMDATDGKWLGASDLPTH